MVIRILDFVSSYATYKDGEVIFEVIAKELDKGNDVTVSFDGINSISSAFANSALVRLIERFTFEEIKRRLHIVDSTRQINRLIKDRFAFAAGASKELPG